MKIEIKSNMVSDYGSRCLEGKLKVKGSKLSSTLSAFKKFPMLLRERLPRTHSLLPKKRQTSQNR
jgi:hypothetical protein